MRKTYNIFKKIGRKNLALSIVALVLTSIMFVGATYSWIENITAVQITNMPQNGTGSDTSKLKFASDINKTIELGNCGPDSTNGAISKFNAVNLGTYFNESGGMHLTTCSGNGESFYFKTLKGSGVARPFRIGTEDDENVHYISATFMVCSPDADVDMWFNEIPKVECGGSYNTDSIARYSITVDGETHVYSSSGDKYSHIHDATGTTEQVDVRKTSEYTFGHEQNVKDGKANGNVLFRVGEKPKKVTVKIWLQYTGIEEKYTDLKPDINMVLASTWAKTRKITVFDGTSQNNGEQWMTNNDSPKLYVALASDPNKYHWELTMNKDTHMGTVDIPSYYYTGNKIYVLRCENGWNTGNIKCGSSSINCWNYWETKLPKGFDDLKFNIVGNTPVVYTADDTFHQSDTGYSFWGEADHITVTNTMGLTNDKDGPNRMLVKDENTGNFYPLCSNGNAWTGYIPHTSDKIAFLYKKDGFQNNNINSKNSTTNTDNCYKNETPDHSWGYNKSDTNPQTRPYNDMTYNIYGDDSGTWTDLIETNYRLAGYFNGDTGDTSKWNETNAFYKVNESDNVALAYITLQADKLNQIKVVDVTDISNKKYYSNDGVMCRSNCTNWPMKTDVSNNMGFITDGYDGTYKFEFNTKTKQLTVTYPGSGGKSRVYLVTNYDGYYKYAYMWNGGNNNGTFPGQKMDWLGQIGDNHIYLLKYPDNLFPTNVQFTGQGNENHTDQKWKSKSLSFSGYQLYTNPSTE